jgi:hypothetical protein
MDGGWEWGSGITYTKIWLAIFPFYDRHEAKQEIDAPTGDKIVPLTEVKVGFPWKKRSGSWTNLCILAKNEPDLAKECVAVICQPRIYHWGCSFLCGKKCVQTYNFQYKFFFFSKKRNQRHKSQKKVYSCFQTVEEIPEEGSLLRVTTSTCPFWVHRSKKHRYHSMRITLTLSFKFLDWIASYIVAEVVYKM